MINFASARNQAVASAAALVPTAAICAPMAARGADIAGTVFAALGIYFIAVLALAARTRRRLWWALGLTAAALAIEWFVLGVAGDTDMGLQTALLFLIPIAYVAAWGIARRHNARWWKIGLPLAAITVIAPLRGIAAVLISDGHASPMSFWLWWPGVVTAGSLVCWAADATAQRVNRVRTRSATADAHGQREARSSANEAHAQEPYTGTGGRP